MECSTTVFLKQPQKYKPCSPWHGAGDGCSPSSVMQAEVLRGTNKGTQVPEAIMEGVEPSVFVLTWLVTLIKQILSHWFDFLGYKFLPEQIIIWCNSPPLTSTAAARPAAWGSAGPSPGWAGKPARAPGGAAGSPAGSPWRQRRKEEGHRGPHSSLFRQKFPLLHCNLYQSYSEFTGLGLAYIHWGAGGGGQGSSFVVKSHLVCQENEILTW